MRDVRAELVRSKAYRITYWVWPLILLSTLAAVAFSSSAIQKALEEGATPTSQIEAAAFMPGSPTFFSGLLLAFWTTTLVTADWSSGTINHIHMAMSDGRILRAKLIMVSAASLLTTVITTGTAVALSFLLLPSSLVLATLPSSVFWVNVLGTLAVHLTWGLLALVAAWWLSKPALSVGAVLVVVLGAPALETAFASAGVSTPVFSYLPSSLMNTATLTGSELATKMTPLMAGLLLVAWCAVALASAPIALRRGRIYH